MTLSAVVVDPPRSRIYPTREWIPTSWCTACRARLGHVSWGTRVHPSLGLARETASSTNSRGQRRCMSHHQDTCTKAVPSTNPWQKAAYYSISPPALCSPPMNAPPRLLADIACHATAIVSAIISSRSVFVCTAVVVCPFLLRGLPPCWNVEVNKRVSRIIMSQAPPTHKRRSEPHLHITSSTHTYINYI